MSASERPGSRRRQAMVFVVAILGSIYLSRLSLSSARESGRPSPVPERLIGAMAAPGERLAARTARGLRALTGAVFLPRAWRKESLEAGARAETVRLATEALRAYAPEEGTESAPEIRSDTEPMLRSLERGLPAQVLGADPTGRRRLILIGAGARDDVRSGMGVVLGPDLVGRVERVNRSTCVAHLCTDREFWAPVRCLRSGDYLGTIQGNGGDSLEVRSPPAGSDVREGDVLTTASSLDGLPAELRVAVVERVTLVDVHLTQGRESPSEPPGTLVVIARPLAQVAGCPAIEIVPSVRYGD